MVGGRRSGGCWVGACLIERTFSGVVNGGENEVTTTNDISYDDNDNSANALDNVKYLLLCCWLSKPPPPPSSSSLR